MTKRENKLRQYGRLSVNIMGISLLIGLYFALKLGLIFYHYYPTQEIILWGMPTDVMTICGLLTEAQVMVLVCLTVCYHTKGYIISNLLCLFTVGSHLFPLLRGGNIISVIGMIMIIGAALINCIIYQYAKKINSEKAKYHELSVFDSLTGLANRRMIIEVLNEEVHKKTEDPFYLVFIDLDDFKKINDYSGHAQGDLLLQKVVEHWKKVLRSEDVLGRLGGDEFALIIRGEMSKETIKEYLDQLRLGLKDSIEIDGRKYSVSACFGVALYPEDSRQYEDLLKYADMAMYEAKSQGKDGIVFFSKEISLNGIHIDS